MEIGSGASFRRRSGVNLHQLLCKMAYKYLYHLPAKNKMNLFLSSLNLILNILYLTMMSVFLNK